MFGRIAILDDAAERLVKETAIANRKNSLRLLFKFKLIW
jgi:hypothetical protein